MLNPDQHNDFHSLNASLPEQTAPSRRTALKLLGVGYAASTLPTQAQTAIKTSAEGLTAGEVTIEVNGFKMPAYRAFQTGRTKLPVVLVVHEVFGVHEYIADVARRFAQAGYMAIAPELFARQGDPGEYGELAKLLSEVVAKVPDAQVMGDLDAVVAWAGSQGADTARVGITGFCWGGRITWLYAAHNPKVKAGVAWYGRLAGESNAMTPKHPLQVAGALHAPVLGLYGAADTGIPLSSVDSMKQALATGSAPAKASEFVVYPDAPHAFHADYRPTYRQAPAQDGWRRALAWFKTHGV